jgi:hypothetical protein
MVVLAGDEYFDIVTLRDPAGDPVSGAVWDTVFAQTSDGTSFALEVEETASPGTYLVSMTPTDQTAYHRILVASKDGRDYPFAGTLHAVSRALPFEHYVSIPAEEVLYLVDADGDPVIGATFAVTTAEAPHGGSFVLEQRSLMTTPGGYVLGVTPDRTGVWSAEVESDTIPPRRFALSFVVQGTGDALPITVITAPEWGFAVERETDLDFGYALTREDDLDFSFAVEEEPHDG